MPDDVSGAKGQIEFSPECYHQWAYGGVKYDIEEYPRNFGEVPIRRYFEWFYCTKCLASQYRKMAYENYDFQPVQFGATPR